MIVLIFEWDGVKPPSGFYRRLHRYGLFVGERDREGGVGAIARRISSGNVAGENYNAVIFQEGTVICDSERLAMNIYQKALELAAAYNIRLSAQMLRATPQEVHLTAGDINEYNKVESVLGRRGRPAGVKQDWIVTCHECGATVEVANEFGVVCCTECGSSDIRSRPGEFLKYKVPQGDLFESWMRHRFASGQFEVPDVRDSVKEPPETVTIGGDEREEKRVRQAVNDIMNSPVPGELERCLPRPVAMSYLDAIFLARAYKPTKARQEARTGAILDLYQKGVLLDLFELDSVSILDAACISGVGPERAANTFKIVKENCHENATK